MDAKEFRRLGHALVDWGADYREQLERLPVMSPVQPGETRRMLPISPPTKGSALDDLFPELERVVLPGIMHWNHPRFFAYFPSNTTYASIFADLVISGLGVQGMSWQTSPAATEVEEVMMDWVLKGKQMIRVSIGAEMTDQRHVVELWKNLCAASQT